MNTLDSQTNPKSFLSLARIACAMLIAVAGTITASAHPGHGPSDVPISHWFNSPDHLALITGCGLLCWVLASRVNRGSFKYILRGLGLALWIFSACMIAWTF